MRKFLLGGLLATTMLIPAFAADDMWRSSKLIGLNVYNDQNEKLGDISEILMDKSGKVDGVIIGVGGFLGMGQHDIKVEMSKLKFVNAAGSDLIHPSRSWWHDWLSDPASKSSCRDDSIIHQEMVP